MHLGNFTNTFLQFWKKKYRMLTSLLYCNFMATNFAILENKILHVNQFLLL